MSHDEMMNCPAGVEAFQICAECEDEETPGCWRCVRGLIPCPDPDAYDGPHGLVFVHGEDCTGHA